MSRRTIPSTAVSGDGRPERLVERLTKMERQIEDLQRVREAPPTDDPDMTPLPFHWPGAVADHVNVRNGPGEFGGAGVIWMVRYRWDTAPTGAATVQWKLNGTTVMTHTLPASTNPHVEYPAQAYAQQAIVAVPTAAGAGVGLTAFVYFR